MSYSVTDKMSYSVTDKMSYSVTDKMSYSVTDKMRKTLSKIDCKNDNERGKNQKNETERSNFKK